MNQAVEECSGEWIIFLNAGDYFVSELVLENIFKQAVDSNVCILYGDAILKDDAEEVIWKSDISKLPYKMPFCHQACFMKRKIFQKKKFDTTYKIVADFNMILELYLENSKFEYINEIVSIFELDGVSSTNYKLKEKEHYDVLKRQGIAGMMVILFYYKAVWLACVKGIIEKYFSNEAVIFMRKIYKRRIKKYCTKEEYYENIRKKEWYC